MIATQHRWWWRQLAAVRPPAPCAAGSQSCRAPRWQCAETAGSSGGVDAALDQQQQFLAGAPGGTEAAAMTRKPERKPSRAFRQSSNSVGEWFEPG